MCWLREAIKLGIRDAGYNPILIDEVEHNELITPELLSHIRNSRFVVVDLTHQNNGAYFEDLTSEQKKAFFKYNFVVRILPDINDAELRAIFQRLNKNVVALNKQSKK